MNADGTVDNRTRRWAFVAVALGMIAAVLAGGAAYHERGTPHRYTESPIDSVGEITDTFHVRGARRVELWVNADSALVESCKDRPIPDCSDTLPVVELTWIVSQDERRIAEGRTDRDDPYRRWDVDYSTMKFRSFLTESGGTHVARVTVLRATPAFLATNPRVVIAPPTHEWKDAWLVSGLIQLLAKLIGIVALTLAMVTVVRMLRKRFRRSAVQRTD